MLKSFTSAALALGLSLGATGATALESMSTPIFKAPIGANEASKSKRFAINPELGRAWVEIDIWHDPSERYESYRAQVPGLSFDKTTSQVVFNANGQTVVCANVREAGALFFKHQRIELTGDCELTRKYVKLPIDNGFSQSMVEHVEVHFKPVNRVGLVSQSVSPQG